MLPPMHSTQIVPIFTTDRMAATRRFWIEQLGCAVSFDHPAYLGVRVGAAEAPELGFMLPDHEAPEPFAGAGAWLSLRVADADAECARLRRSGVPIRDEPADMPWGSRRFTVVDPNGIVVAIQHPIPMTPEFAAHSK